MTCTFYGHWITPEEIKPVLRQTLVDLIENKNVDKFYVGDNGNFDIYVKEILKELKEIYPINYYVVLIYSSKRDIFCDYDNTIFFKCLGIIPHKYKRVCLNKWMIGNSDYVVAHIRNIKNSTVFKRVVQKKGKKVINLLV